MALTQKTPLKRKKALARRKKVRRPKSALAKRKANKNSVYWRAKADSLWSQVVRRKNNGRCLYCGEPARDAHHLISRAVKAFRHSLMNGVPLCYQHHRGNARASAHGGPLAFAEWLRTTLPDIWAWVQANKHKLGQHDYQAACERLQGILDGAEAPSGE